MNIVTITIELNKCLKYTNTEEDLITCLNYAFEKCGSDKNSEIMIIPQDDAVIVKKMIFRIVIEKQLSLNYVFKKLWWNKNKEINVIAAYFISDIFKDPDDIDWVFFRQALDRLKNWDLTTIVSSVLEKLILTNISHWELYLHEMIKLNNKWALRLAALILGKIAITHSNEIPALLNILMLLKRNQDWEVQQAVSWCLNNMAGVISEPLEDFENLARIDIRKAFSLN